MGLRRRGESVGAWEIKSYVALYVPEGAVSAHLAVSQFTAICGLAENSLGRPLSGGKLKILRTRPPLIWEIPQLKLGGQSGANSFQ